MDRHYVATPKGLHTLQLSKAEKGLYASKITPYAQGFALLRSASKEYGFGFSPTDIARIWRAGCIIRASLLDDIVSAFETEPEVPNLLLNDVFRKVVMENQSAWRDVAKTAINLGIPMMGISASLAYFDAYRSERLPANLIQAQRDFFGAHTYRPVDKEGGSYKMSVKNMTSRCAEDARQFCRLHDQGQSLMRAGMGSA